MQVRPSGSNAGVLLPSSGGMLALQPSAFPPGTLAAPVSTDCAELPTQPASLVVVVEEPQVC